VDRWGKDTRCSPAIITSLQFSSPRRFGPPRAERERASPAEVDVLAPFPPTGSPDSRTAYASSTPPPPPLRIYLQRTPHHNFIPEPFVPPDTARSPAPTAAALSLVFCPPLCPRPLKPPSPGGDYSKRPHKRDFLLERIATLSSILSILPPPTRARPRDTIIAWSYAVHP
jgi:hypothetical protein